MKNDVYAEYLTNQIISKQLQFDDKGNLTGGTETMQELKKTCPDAFAAEQQNSHRSRFWAVHRDFPAQEMRLTSVCGKLWVYRLTTNNERMMI